MRLHFPRPGAPRTWILLLAVSAMLVLIAFNRSCVLPPANVVFSQSAKNLEVFDDFEVSAQIGCQGGNSIYGGESRSENRVA